MSARVVVVEDDQDARELLALMLARYKVDAVATVDEAVRAVEAACPDVIVSDLRLGSESARRLVQIVAARNLRVPFLIISGYLDPNQQPEGLIKAYLTKPFESAALLEAVERLLAGQDS